MFSPERGKKKKKREKEGGREKSKEIWEVVDVLINQKRGVLAHSKYLAILSLSIIP